MLALYQCCAGFAFFIYEWVSLFKENLEFDIQLVIVYQTSKGIEVILWNFQWYVYILSEHQYWCWFLKDVIYASLDLYPYACPNWYPGWARYLHNIALYQLWLENLDNSTHFVPVLLILNKSFYRWSFDKLAFCCKVGNGVDENFGVASVH